MFEKNKLNIYVFSVSILIELLRELLADFIFFKFNWSVSIATTVALRTAITTNAILLSYISLMERINVCKNTAMVDITMIAIFIFLFAPMETTFPDL